MKESDFLTGNIAIICNEAIGHDWFILKLSSDMRRTDAGTAGRYSNRFISTYDLAKYEIKIARKLIRDGIFRVKLTTNYGIVFENGTNIKEKHQRLMNIYKKRYIPEVEKEKIMEVLNDL
jgi:hypothetical protein